MTKDNFYKFVDSFDGKYTEVDLLAIGCKFRELPVKQRNWDDLVVYLGINKTGNAFRQWIYRNEDAYRDSVNQSTSGYEEVEDSNSRYQEEYKLITKNRDILNSYRRLIRSEARFDTLKDAIVSVVDQLNSLPEYEKPVAKKLSDLETCDNEAVALLSDLHLGVNCENYYNKYNFQIATERLFSWCNSVIEYCTKFDVQRLNILNLGDMIHGLIHISARVEQEFDVITQIMLAAEMLAKVLNRLDGSLPCEITYRAVSDNHSRAKADLKENITSENFQRLIDWYLEERLKDTNITFKFDNIDDGIAVVTLLNGKTLVAVHGHEDKKTSIVQDMSGLLRRVPDYIALGHYHNVAQHCFQGTKVFVNGSIVGTEQYAFGRRLFSEPEQKLLIFNSHKSVIDIDINLSDIN